MSSPYASAGPSQRCPCPQPACGPICLGTHGDWQRCGGTCSPHHTARGKASTLKRQSVYVTSTPGSVDLKISISNLAGASRFLSLLPLQLLHLHWWPAVSLAVEYPSESGAPLSREEGGDPPALTVAHWDFSGLPRSHTAPVWGLILASVLSPILEVLLSCGGVLPTSWLEESDSCAAPTGVLRAEFSA